MKHIYFIVLFFLFVCSLSAQGIQGQWKGSFADNSSSFMNWGGSKSEYVLELEIDKRNNVTGYSYTYFYEDGKKYYTICKLRGTYKSKSRYIEVVEFERTKTNVPVNINNCFQTHKLTYFKKGGEESLEGTWIPAPNQSGDCGFGTTVLSKRVLKQMPAFSQKKQATTITPKLSSKTPAKKQQTIAANSNSVKKNPEKAKDASKKATTNIPKLKNSEAAKVEDKAVATQPADIEKKVISIPKVPIAFGKRDLSIVKNIELDTDEFTVDLYDNGDIDGDTVSVIYNGKVLVNKKRLTAEAISLKLKLDENAPYQELIMYAENLGSIPPNTAVMIVRDKGHRYEVRITSDLQKSGTVRFSRKE